MALRGQGQALEEAFRERMLGVGQSLEARGEMPETAEEFAEIVTHVVFDQLAGGLLALSNRRDEQD